MSPRAADTRRQGQPFPSSCSSSKGDTQNSHVRCGGAIPGHSDISHATVSSVSTLHLIPSGESPPSHPCGFQNRTESNLCPDLPEGSQKVKATRASLPSWRALCSGALTGVQSRALQGRSPPRPGSAWGLPPEAGAGRRHQDAETQSHEPGIFISAWGPCDPRATHTFSWAKPRMWRSPRRAAH